MIDTRNATDPRQDKLRETLEALAARTEAQAFFTAVMTDTYIEDEEGDDEQESD